MHWQGDIEEFVSSFLEAPPDSAPLEIALTSIPQDRWWMVWGRIVTGLDDEMVKLLPSLEEHFAAEGVDLSDEDDQVLAKIELKERLLHQEGHRRLSRR
jgi:hypothetical protein